MRLDSVAAAGRYVDAFCARVPLSGARCYRVRLAIEELVTNLFKYTEADGFDLTIGGTEPVEIELRYAAPPFEPVAGAPEAKPLDEREPGGLGLFLVQSLSRTFAYRYENGENVYHVTL